MVAFAPVLSNCLADEDDYWFPIPAGPIPASDLLIHRGDLIAGGLFDSIGGVAATNVARWDGAKWSQLGQGLAGQVGALASDGTHIYAGVFFAPPKPLSSVARWDGVGWTHLGTGVDGGVSALALLGTDLFAGGRFHRADDALATNIARWDGVRWNPIGEGLRILEPSCLDCNPDRPPPGFYGSVHSLAVIGNDLFAGGAFDWAGGVRATNVARWDGSRWHALGGGLPAIVTSLAVFRNELYANAQYWNADFSEQVTVSKWNGTNWVGIASSDLGVRELAADAGYLYAASSFNEINSIPANRIARWDGHAWVPLGSGLTGGGGLIDVASTGTEVYVTGSFSKAGNTPAGGMAVWQIPQMLKTKRQEKELIVSWPAPDADLKLEFSMNLAAGNWSALTNTPIVIARRLTVTNSISDGNQRFYRLRK